MQIFGGITASHVSRSEIFLVVGAITNIDGRHAINKSPNTTAQHGRGDALEDRTILLHSEQGFGDSIMFYRFAHKLAEAGSNVILHCQPALKRFFSDQNPNVAVLGTNIAPPSHDVHASLMSLPFLMELNKEETLSLPKTSPNHDKATLISIQPIRLTKKSL